MQTIVSARAARPPVGAVLIGVAVGGILLLGGVVLGWLAFTTPVLSGLSATSVRPDPAQVAMGAVVWGVGLVAPPCFAIVGALRLSHVARSLSAKPPLRALSRIGDTLGDDYVAASSVRLPDGRVVRDLVLGPFGFAVISELPPASVIRHAGNSWEIRRSDGRWVHLEHPLERAARDAERVRRWIASTERDYVVKAYAAVVTPDPTVIRTANCAVIRSDQVAAWLTSLPAARALTPDRRADLVGEIRAVL